MATDPTDGVRGEPVYHPFATDYHDCPHEHHYCPDHDEYNRLVALYHRDKHEGALDDCGFCAAVLSTARRYGPTPSEVAD